MKQAYEIVLNRRLKVSDSIRGDTYLNLNPYYQSIYENFSLLSYFNAHLQVKIKKKITRPSKLNVYFFTFTNQTNLYALHENYKD